MFRKILNTLLVATLLIGLGLSNAFSDVPVAKGEVQSSPVYVYRVDPTGYVCGTTGPSPNIVELRLSPSDSNHNLQIRIRKCDGTSFSKNGRVEVYVNGTRISNWDHTYFSGVSVISFYVDPVAEKQIYGPNNYQVYVYSSDQPSIPKYTGTIMAWEEYTIPTPTQHNYIYQVDPGNYVCGSYIQAQLVPNDTNHDIDVYINKCDGTSFNQSGKAYVYVDNVPRWGPFNWASGGTMKYLGSIDPVALDFSGTHSYKVVAYSGDQPTNPNKYSGSISAWETVAQDTVRPTVTLTSPSDDTTIGIGSVQITADAEDTGGSGLRGVEFYVGYDGVSHNLGLDTNAPYSMQWNTTTGLKSQRILIAVYAIDNAGNYSHLGENTYVYVNFVESAGNSGVQENWVPSDRRAYLNQRSLNPPTGDYMCSAASASMLLAMNGLIARDNNAMSSEAIAIYGNGRNAMWQVQQSLNARGMSTNAACMTTDTAWNTVVSEVDAGRPSVILSKLEPYWHYFVVVGYHEEGNTREVIAYDPFGEWVGTYYDANTTSSDSHKGQWVFYDFDVAWGYERGSCAGDGEGWLLTAQPAANLVTIYSQLFSGVPTSPPDEISDEPENLILYEGIIPNDYTIYLPIIAH